MAARKDTGESSAAHSIAKLTIAFGLGLAVALYAYHRVTDPEPAAQRAREEAAVLAAREILKTYIEPTPELRIVDPLSPNRAVGKSYVYPGNAGWEISGHYRRSQADRWHPFLMRLNPDHSLASLSVKDGNRSLVARSRSDSRLTATP
jgi:hypothetical protein